MPGYFYMAPGATFVLKFNINTPVLIGFFRFADRRNSDFNPLLLKGYRAIVVRKNYVRLVFVVHIIFVDLSYVLESSFARNFETYSPLQSTVRLTTEDISRPTA